MSKKTTSKIARHKYRMTRRKAAELPLDFLETITEWQKRPCGLALTDYSARLLSQHGEDGMTVEVFRRIGLRHRRAVEIGCGANGGNAGVMVGLGCRGLMLDGNKELIKICGRVYRNYPVRARSVWIMRGTIAEELAYHGFGGELDYLGIDLDGVDYWIWDALTVRPRLVIVEYNVLFGAEAAVTVPYANDFSRKIRDMTGRLMYPKGYYGASLMAFVQLGERRGYRLVGTAPNSGNAYFVRADCAHHFPLVTPAEAIAPAPKGSTGIAVKEMIEVEGVLDYFERRGWPLVEV